MCVMDTISSGIHYMSIGRRVWAISNSWQKIEESNGLLIEESEHFTNVQTPTIRKKDSFQIQKTTLVFLIKTATNLSMLNNQTSCHG